MGIFINMELHCEGLITTKNWTSDESPLTAFDAILLQVELVRQLQFFFFLPLWFRDAGDGAATDPNGLARDSFRHALRLQGIVHPRAVKLKGTLRFTLFAITVGVNTRVSTVQQLKQLEDGGKM